MNSLSQVRYAILLFLALLFFAAPTWAEQTLISDNTQECLGCHSMVTPGIVADWQKSGHSHTSPKQAMELPVINRRISTDKISDTLNSVVIGCAECHTMNSDRHEKDRFEHNGFVIHTVVSPSDCATCHPVEVEDFSHNLMSQAYGNLMDNPVYQIMVNNTNGLATFDNGTFHHAGADEISNADSCLSCHGTVVEVTGKATRETDMGDMEFPTLSNWPNAGVGRINPDGSKGACASCHMRHQFSIEVARKPYTCAECHKGPDVPAYKVYSVSVHGNIQKSVDKYWDYKAVPWTVGKDFTAPTCAACHVSELVNSEGEVLAKRSHRMTDRLPWRIFGLPYAHPHPIHADTTGIVNKAGLTLPTELTGELVSSALISPEEMSVRTDNMKKVCSGCHSEQWVEGHFSRLDRSIETSNHMTLQATKILSTAWQEGLAQGLPQGANPFDEALEMKWIEQWLFYGNSVRFATAMGGVDYGVFADGRWTQARNLQEMGDYLKFLRAGQKSEKNE
nr:multiheme c-type cytochrome [uncultured Desulfuromonas sp.]